MIPIPLATAAQIRPLLSRRRCLAAACLSPVAAFGVQPPTAIEWPALTLIDGSALSARAWRDTAAVVVFFSTDCAYCVRHNARIDKLYRGLGERPLRVLGAALDGDAKAVRRFLAAKRYRFPVVADAAALRERFTPRRVVPMTCVVGLNGRLLQAIPGEMAEPDVLELADKVLAAR